MRENFLLSARDARDLAPSVRGATSKERSPDRESLRLLLIGSQHGVTGTIQTLHRLRFAEVSEWSLLLPGPNPGEVMSILTRYIAVN
ncbi:MAG: hypothetical protein ACAF41_20745 [Leptolyngbya sp. BL-A-14]